MRVEYVSVRQWPKLAWMAICSRSSREITCFVGRDVETTDEWFCEGIWADSYSQGDFDQTDLFFGSGGRLRDGALIFVSAGSTLDRLHSLQRNGDVWISNSLPCLMSLAAGSLELDCLRYEQVFNSIVKGLDAYERELPTTAGSVGMTYFDNLIWDGEELTSRAKPGPLRDFGSYARYRAFLDSALAMLTANAQATERTHPFGLMSTLSTGYDSTATTVLAREAGCREAVGLNQSRTGLDDSGKTIAEILGIDIHLVETSAWRNAPGAAVRFLAAGAGGGGETVFSGAEVYLRDRVVFTGFHGDKMWDSKTEDLGPNIVRGDNSGLDFTEYRLSAGFINCPVPYLGVRQIKDVYAINHSAELEPWNVGGQYNRPICRRIVEECGVPRTMFGVRKRATHAPLHNRTSFLTAELRAEYFRWLDSRRLEGSRRRELAPWSAALIDHRARFGDSLNRVRRKPWVRRLGPRADRALGAAVEITRRKVRHLHRHVIHWAVDSAREQYPSPF